MHSILKRSLYSNVLNQKFTYAFAVIASSVIDERTFATITATWQRLRQPSITYRPVVVSIVVIVAYEPGVPVAVLHRLQPIAIANMPTAIESVGSFEIKIKKHRNDLKQPGLVLEKCRHRVQPFAAAGSKPGAERGSFCAFLYVSCECRSRACFDIPLWRISNYHRWGS